MSPSLRRSGARTHSRPVSRRASAAAAPVLALLLAASLVACGDSDSDSGTGTDPESSSSPTSTEEPTETPTETPTTPAPSEGSGGSGPIPVTGDAGVTEATLVSATDVGGSASPLAFVLDTEKAQADFAGQFTRGFGDTVLAELESRESAAGSIPYGAIVAVGCDAPESVQIDAGEAGLQVTPELPKKTVQCFAPMTFVVLFAAPGF